jgi:RimJ/RimL family protein N-acetyltransferase
VRLIARWAFDALGIARLELTCGPDNEVSQRVALRCGFVREGVMRSHLPFKGGRRDTVLFSLLPGELTD